MNTNRIHQISVTNRSASFELTDTGLYYTDEPYNIYLNGEPYDRTETSVFSVYGLEPDQNYHMDVYKADEVYASCSFTTRHESVTLNVKRFGAVGDGIHTDTAAIQAAIECCPPDGRILIPKGKWKCGSLFLKSNIYLEICEDAQIFMIYDRDQLPILPGMILTTDETDDYNLGSWEGNPLDMYAALLNGIHINDVCIYGKGILDGCASADNWWKEPKKKIGAFRPRMIFLNHCENIIFQGITVTNSPSWNIHPYFSKRLYFLNMRVLAPSVSPNTDGFDPESCSHVLVAGTFFSVGDDCIALKSGKIYMGKRYKTPCSDIEISHCLMENGHGGVTIGSEMAGGIRSVNVHDCLMRNTDRGLRIKTRRGRGKDAVVTDITFRNIRMNKVKVPFVVNAMYFCDPDGKNEYVQTRKALKADERTPELGTFEFNGIYADGVCCAGYILALPEKPLQKISLTDIIIKSNRDPEVSIIPAMASGVECLSASGFIFHNITDVEMKNVVIDGIQSERLCCENVNSLTDV